MYQVDVIEVAFVLSDLSVAAVVSCYVLVLCLLFSFRACLRLLQLLKRPAVS